MITLSALKVSRREVTMPKIKQPALTDNWGVPFHGKAQTTTGDVWWYEQDGKRFPLRPLHVELGGDNAA